MAVSQSNRARLVTRVALALFLRQRLCRTFGAAEQRSVGHPLAVLRALGRFHAATVSSLKWSISVSSISEVASVSNRAASTLYRLRNRRGIVRL